MYSDQELADMHFMYCSADGIVVGARRLYEDRYPARRCPDRKTYIYGREGV
jgi:hypothetical protein